jgi:primary-amine oxidase
MQTVDRALTTGQHPLDPLSAQEIEAASGILKSERKLQDSARFVYISLKEPAKETVLSYQPGDTVPREAHVVIRERVEHRTYEAVVSLTDSAVLSWREVPGAQAPIMFEEFLASEEIVKQDPRWQEAMRKRGVTDLENVMIDPWSVGYNGPEDGSDRGRFIRPLTWVRQGGPDDNGYARPVEGLILRFDLDRMRSWTSRTTGSSRCRPRTATTRRKRSATSATSRGSRRGRAPT